MGFGGGVLMPSSISDLTQMLTNEKCPKQMKNAHKYDETGVTAHRTGSLSALHSSAPQISDFLVYHDYRFQYFQVFFAVDTVIDLESWLIIPFDIQGLCLAVFVSIPLSKVPSFFPVM